MQYDSFKTFIFCLIIQEFSNLGIAHKKIRVPGGPEQQAPPDACYEE